LHAEGQLSGSSASRKEDVWKSVQGNLKVTAFKGEIRQSPLFNSILLALKFSQGFVIIPGIRDLNLVNMVRDVAKTLGRTLDVSRMVFKKIDGSFQVTDGVVYTDDLYFEGDTADFVFKGAFDLVREEINMQINVIPTGTIDSLVTKIPLVGKQMGRVKKAALSFRLVARGPFGDPKVQLLAVDKLTPGKN